MPDGYELRHSDRRGGGIMGELFLGGRGGNRSSLAKQGAVHTLRSLDTRRYWQEITLVGWIVE